MKVEKLIKEVNKTYKGSLWRKHGKCRIYINYTSKVTTYIELKVVNDKVIDAHSSCFYTGAEPSSNKWIRNYIEDAKEHIEEVRDYIIDLIEDEGLVS